LRTEVRIAVVTTAVILVVGAGCRRDMQDQPRYDPLEKSGFFEDQRASRPLVPGTVARGHLDEDEHLYTGRVAGTYVDELPFPASREVLTHGRERYDIYCSPCHDRTGGGFGMIVQRGFRRPPSFHTERLRASPDGYFFDVVTHGFGAMPGYAAQIPVGDRWAIVAYIRALQLSQHATVADVPEGERGALVGARP
jgi:mono/diheme cytochrome c family protein